ncbi:MAG: DUF4332 domain-containing protein [Anaerolineales bacterium]|nr:DUF4332 domain-containing protein [Anaerolineales bacterium]
MPRIIDIEGIGPKYAEKLIEAGVRTTDALLEKGKTPKGRQELSQTTGISDSLILEWVNHADLYRIVGVGSEYSDLLEEAGVDTVPELANRNPENLFQKLVSVNQEKELVRKLPTENQVADWVSQAKKLERIITY